MRLSEYKEGLPVKICNNGDFAMTHKKWIGKVGTIVKQCRGGNIWVKMNHKHHLSCPLRVLKVVVKSELDESVEEFKNGNIVYHTLASRHRCTVDDILNKPIDNMLDALQTFEHMYISNPVAKDVNDLAITHIVKTLKEQVQRETEKEN